MYLKDCPFKEKIMRIKPIRNPHTMVATVDKLILITSKNIKRRKT